MSSKVARGEECEAQPIPRAAQRLTIRAGRISHLRQVLELLSWPEEVRVWLLLTQLHPVAMTVEILQGMKCSPEALASQGVVKGSGCHQGLPQSPYQLRASLIQSLSIKVQVGVIPGSRQEVLGRIGTRHLT